MNDFELIRQLVEAEQPFALATVVRCEPPASARPGAKAVIRVDGSMQGWVGGSCAQPLVVKEAQRVLSEGRPCLIRLCPNAGESGRQQPDVVEYLMTCHSGGTLEIFVEPVMPQPRLCIVGETPVALTLATLGQALGYRVERVDPAALTPERFAPGRRTAVVIATMGAADEEAVEAALRSAAPYVALVASPRRAAVLRDYLATRGVPAERIAKLRAPAGLDIGARTQEEIALSIMAEIVQLRSSPTNEELATAVPAAVEARDPVCGMTVSVRDARISTEHEGATYYFCCPHCKSEFEAAPLRFLAAIG
jgi:xanthine dehydrogenase accessory factor